MTQGMGSDVAGSNERYFASLYSELRRLAERHLRRNAGLPVTPTTLLHETYLGMAGSQAQFPDQMRFMSYASRAMRNLIIDFARERRAQKRGSEFHLTHLDTNMSELIPAGNVRETDLVKLSEALDELAAHDARLAEVVDLRYFCGFSLAEVAALRAVSERTVQRDWEKARILLFNVLKDADVP